MVIEDYSPVGHDPLADDPSGDVYEGKFVHIIGPNDEYLCFSPRGMAKYHANIAQIFSRRREFLSFIMHPSGEDGRFATPGWTVKGGGRFRLSRTNKTLELWGTSKAYGKFDGPDLQAKIKTVSGWNSFDVQLADPT
jgi:hypothetical protein